MTTKIIRGRKHFAAYSNKHGFVWVPVPDIPPHQQVPPVRAEDETPEVLEKIARAELIEDRIEELKIEQSDLLARLAAIKARSKG